MNRREWLQVTLAGLAAGPAAGRMWAVPDFPALTANQSDALPYDRMAFHITRALRPAAGERVILRHDPSVMPGLVPVLRQQLESAGAGVQTMRYGPGEGFEQQLAQTDIYVWLPAGPSGATPSDQQAALVRWLDSGRGRQIHFHWADGTRAADGSNGQHSAVFDRLYLDALEIDYAALDRAMDETIARLRAGEVRVTTGDGTDIRFRVGDRPFCKQNGDASLERMKSARVRIDREIELPAGALRVAPIEESVKGRVLLPSVNLVGAPARRVELKFDKGRLRGIDAAMGKEAVRNTIRSNPALEYFREFALGMNPKLVKPEDTRWIPYYGYGAGVVRLSLGDNEELGGTVRGGAVRWFFFPDATIKVGATELCKDGVLTLA